MASTSSSSKSASAAQEQQQQDSLHLESAFASLQAETGDALMYPPPPPLLPQQQQQPQQSGKKRKTSEKRSRVNSSEVPEGDDGPGGKKRNRVHFSCGECHRRKQKCDRSEPCGQCIARKVPHLCRPFVNGVEDPQAYDHDVRARLSQIENLLSQLVNPENSNIAPQQQSNAGPSLQALLQGPGDDLFHPQQPPPPPSRAYKPPPSGFIPASPPQIELRAEDTRGVLATLKESGIGIEHLRWVLGSVPDRNMADALVELYFREIDWTRYKMYRPNFQKRYTAFYDALQREPQRPTLDQDTLKWLPLLFIVLAIATLSASTELVGPPDQQVAWSRRFYGSARSSLEYAKALQNDNLDVLFAGLLAARYMLLTRRPAEGSTPLTTAFQLGLYRDGTVINLADKREIEIRRRAWAMLYHLDRTTSLLVGRPASISDAHTDTRPPANLDDDEIDSGDFDPNGHPITTPTTYTYVILRQLPEYQTVLNLDRELLAWRENLPSFFSLTNPDTSLDADHPYLFVQRHLLSCEWYYTRITLNRPYLLRRKPTDSRYAYSRNAAIESATADLWGRRAFVMEKGDLIVNSGGYRVLNSYMVLGVTIKLDPLSAQADELRNLLNVVSGRARDSSGRLSEPIVKEELAIVEFLTQKAPTDGQPEMPSDPKARSQTRRPDSSGGRDNPPAPVDLLLNLARTASGRRAAEEEQRQLQLQQRREVEEQRREGRHRSNSVRSNSDSASPWDFVAPAMPGLDVHQPFGQQQRVPRPLQPPPSRRQFGDMGPPSIPSGYDSQSQQQFQNPFHSERPFQLPQQPGVGGEQPAEQAFGTPIVDPYAFSNISASMQNADTSPFNPFALAQTGPTASDGDCSPDVIPDDETAFLNYILSKFANGQPVS